MLLKSLRIIFTMLVLLFCVGFGFISAQDSTVQPEIEETLESTETSVTKSFGSFSLPEGWVEIARYSRNGKYFYTHETEQIGSAMTNISIERGENPYALNEHEMFRYAILRQLIMQTAGSKAEVQGSGTFTKNNEPLYIFTIVDTEHPVTTIQYYIVGNNKHILVHVTDFHNETAVDAKAAAEFIVNSFIWSEL